MSKTDASRTYKDRAKRAAGKTAAFGEDIDIKKYTGTGEERPYQADPSQLPPETREQMLSAGIILDDPGKRAGTYLQMDNTPIHSSARQEGVEEMALSQALGKYDWLSDYLWKRGAVAA